MANNSLTIIFDGNQQLTVDSALDQHGTGYNITSTFGGVTIKNSAQDDGPPAQAGWHNGPVWLDVSFTSIQFNAMVVLQASGTATTPNGASRIAQFTVLANAGPFQPK